MDIRLRKPHTYQVRPGVTRTLPAGWSGAVNDDVGEAAIASGSAVRTDAPPSLPPAGDVPPVGPFSAEDSGQGWWILRDGTGGQIGKKVRKADLDGFDTLSEDDKLAFAIEHAKG